MIRPSGVVKVEDLRVGDRVIGPFGPRKVLAVTDEGDHVALSLAVTGDTKYPRGHHVVAITRAVTA